MELDSTIGYMYSSQWQLIAVVGLATDVGKVAVLGQAGSWWYISALLAVFSHPCRATHGMQSGLSDMQEGLIHATQFVLHYQELFYVAPSECCWGAFWMASVM